MPPSPDKTAPETRTIRDMLMTYGYNGGKRLTDEELAEVLLQEIQTLPDENQNTILIGMLASDQPNDDSTADEIRHSSPVA